MAENSSCPVCVAGVREMVEPVTTSCGHMFCWGCIFTWTEERKVTVREKRETIDQARRCPSCRRPVKHVTPLFGFGCERSEEGALKYPTVIPRRPVNIFDPFEDLSQPSIRRSGRQSVPNRRYNEENENAGTSTEENRGGEEESQTAVGSSGSDRGNRRGSQFQRGGAAANVNRRGMGRGRVISNNNREVQDRGEGRGGVTMENLTRGRFTTPTIGREEVEDENSNEEANAKDGDSNTPALSSSLVPGCARTYQEVCTEYARDYMIQRQTEYNRLTASLVVGQIRETFPDAWGRQAAGQAGKCLRKILNKAIKNRRMSKSIVSRSGVSGPKLTRLEQMTDEIISFRSNDNRPEDGEYMASKARGMTESEKRARGKVLRDASLSAVGPSRSREPRVDSVVRDSLQKITTGMGRQVNADNMAREELEMRRHDREEVRDAQRKEEKEEKRIEREREKLENRLDRERDERREERNQMFQLQMMKNMTAQSQVSPPQQITANSSDDQKLEINLKLKVDDDSETYPVKTFIGSYVELKSSLLDLCGLDSSLPVKVILFRMNRIIDIYLLETGRTYQVEFKIKDDFVRIYLD